MHVKQIIVWAVLSLFVLPGCTEPQREKLDQAADVVTTVAPIGQGIVEGPAGGLIGETAGLWSSIGLNAALAAAYLWKRYRSGQLKQTATAIVKAIEGLPESYTPDVKAAVKAEMVKAEIYSVANPIVDQLKAG